MTKSLTIQPMAWSLLFFMAYAQSAGAEFGTAEPNVMSAIELLVANDNLQQFGPNVSATSLAKQVGTNLSEWEFPMKAVGPYSHQLQARLGGISRQKTPIGFSFTSGNSDPRAVDFQKADVLPITCSLRDLETHTVLSERESTFSAHAYDDDHQPSQIVQKLTDQISTACLDVLEHAPQPKAANKVKTALFKPKWLPDVRVEVREIPANLDKNGQSGAGSMNNEPKKEIIIHNQGTPVIFQFGHERR
jgi:hypothetical protein